MTYKTTVLDFNKKVKLDQSEIIDKALHVAHLRSWKLKVMLTEFHIQWLNKLNNCFGSVFFCLVTLRKVQLENSNLVLRHTFSRHRCSLSRVRACLSQPQNVDFSGACHSRWMVLQQQRVLTGKRRLRLSRRPRVNASGRDSQIDRAIRLFLSSSLPSCARLEILF